MTDPQPIAAHMPALPSLPGMALLKSSAAVVPTAALALTDSERQSLSEPAYAPLPALRPCSDDGFDRCMAALNILPKRKTGADEGEVFLGVYRRLLGHMPAPQLVFVVDAALSRHKWFPAPAELLEIAAEWRRDDAAVREKAQARVALERDRQARLDNARQRLRQTIWGYTNGVQDADLVDLPESWLRIFEAESLIRQREDGAYFIPRRGEQAA